MQDGDWELGQENGNTSGGGKDGDGNITHLSRLSQPLNEIAARYSEFHPAATLCANSTNIERGWERAKYGDAGKGMAIEHRTAKADI